MKCKANPLALFLLLFTFLLSAQTSTAITNTIKLDTVSASEQSILKHTENTENHKTLLAAMRAADLEETLGFDGPFTVFAPSDSAFKKLSEKKLARLLLPENKKELYSLMTYHIVAGNFSASKILQEMCRGAGTATFITVQGNDITATMQGVDIILTDNLGNTARITSADSNQCNGVIHEIDSVIRPGKI